MIKRINKLIQNLRSTTSIQPKIIYVELWKGIGREEAQRNYEIKNNLPPGKPEEYIFISIPSDDMIRERNKEEFT